MSNSLWTVREFASIMRVDERTVRRWQSTGSLRSVRVGGIVRVPSSEVERLTSSDRAPRAEQVEPQQAPSRSAARKP